MKFNRKNTAVTKTVNKAGGEAFKESAKLEFATMLLTSFVKDKFYESENEQVARLDELMKQIKDKKFVAKAAIYARTKYGMRSISHLVASRLPSMISGEKWAKHFYNKVVYRPDDLLEILAAYAGTNGGFPLPKAMQKGLGMAMSEFKEYELAKYRGEGRAISMIDAANLLHPKHTSAIEKLIKGTLKTTGKTWEAKLTAAGQEAETEEEKLEMKGKAWKDLIMEGKLGYFALLRNLRNILEQADEAVLKEALVQLVDPKRIKNSLVLPFRFTTAYTEIMQLSGKNARKVLEALTDAIDIACDNVPKFEGDTLVVLDCSGSMAGKPAEIGSLFAAVLAKSNNADLMLFSDTAKYQSINTRDTAISIARDITFASGGTNFHAIFQIADREYDRIIILSDMQGWIGYDTPTAEFSRYKKRTGASPYVYSFDLNGYGTLQFPEPQVFCLAGFSEKVFDTMKLLETDKNALIHEIEQIEL